MGFKETTTVAYAVKAETNEQALNVLTEAQGKLSKVEDNGLVLDCQTLQFALSDPEGRRLIYELGIASRACICSRMSPMQKLQVVQLVRQQNPKAITLSIGDGANDVPMILGAHLGIAVRGKEGTQSVQASDIAISQFRFLQPLLVCHGRRAYRRVATFLCFYLYKNILLLTADVIWMLQDSFRGLIAFPEYLSIGFNVCFSSWHILFVLGFDKDLPDSVALASPSLYHCGPRRALFNARVFSSWVILAIYHGAIAWGVPALMFGTSEYDKVTPSLYWVQSATAFTNVNMIVCLKLVLVAQNPFAAHTLLPTAGALMLYFLCLLVIGYSSLGNALQPCMEGIPEKLFISSAWAGNKPLLALLITPIIGLLFDFVRGITSKHLSPTPLEAAQQRLAK